MWRISHFKAGRTATKVHPTLEAEAHSWQDGGLTAPETTVSTMSSDQPAQPPLAIVLAAGKGTRMKSELPKVLVPVLGRPMIRYVVDALRSAGVGRIVAVVGYRAELVEAELADEPAIEFAIQAEQLGTGHAVMMCRAQLADHRGPVFIVAGDSPLLQASSVRTLLENFAASGASCVLGTVEKANPSGYGRVVRDEQGNFTGIVEEKDATPAQRDIREVNVSTYVFDSQDLLWALDQLTDANAQREYYITDCPAILMAAGKKVTAEKVLQPCESLSINNMDELALVEEEMKRLGMTRP
jgi:bifunctional UDP-N-acetylglucosamine pyrophosphorylase/glucosamine-1-phosphate N-acetyltransferase/UDP-N-acetylglucosamine pyrophosphorylase